MKHPFFVYFGCKGNENILQREKKNEKICNKKRLPDSFRTTFLSAFSRGDKTRTCDLYVPNVTRYQLRHTPPDIISLKKFHKKSRDDWIRTSDHTPPRRVL